MLNITRLFIRTGPPALIGILVACAELPTTTTTAPASSLSSAGPFFHLDANDTKAYRALAREQDLRLTTCSEEHACELAHFSRALLALFDNQRTAAKHFQEVIAGAPKSRLATVSADWLKVLQDAPSEKERDAHLAKATQSVILELLNREQVAKEELGAREKKLEELSTQLETLKLIDQEMNEKTHRIRPRTRTFQGISEPANETK
jgi:hypothetical protein